MIGSYQNYNRNQDMWVNFRNYDSDNINNDHKSIVDERLTRNVYKN